MRVVSRQRQKGFFVVGETPRDKLVVFILDRANVITLRDKRVRYSIRIRCNVWRE